MITESFLNQKARFYAKYLWNLDLDVPVKINKRLRSTLGQLCYGTYEKELHLAGNILELGYLLDDVLLHELCHWYCRKANIDYRDHSKPFEEELKRIGASSTETTETINGKLMSRIKLGCYKCPKCERNFATDDYLGDEVEHGNGIKEYFCCDKKMEFTGIRHETRDFVPNKKLLETIHAFEKFYGEAN